MSKEIPRCRICGEPKIRGTIDYGGMRGAEPLWMCGTLQADHDDILAYGADVLWDDEDLDEMDWDEI